MKSFKNHINDILSEKFRVADLYSYAPKFEKVFKEYIIDSSRHHSYKGAGSVVELPNAGGDFEFTIAALLDTIAQCDPTLDLDNFGLDYSIYDQEHGGKYWGWLIKTYLNWLNKVKSESMLNTSEVGEIIYEFIAEDWNVFREDMRYYDKYKKHIEDIAKRNIHNIMSFNELSKIASELKQIEINKVDKKELQSQVDIIVGSLNEKGFPNVTNDSENYLFIGVPLTLEAAQHLGWDTRWCTSSRGADNRFANYTSNNTHLFIINMYPNELPGHKIQISFKNSEVSTKNNTSSSPNNNWIMRIARHMEDNLDTYWSDYIYAYRNKYLYEINFNLVIQYMPQDLQYLLKLYANLVSADYISKMNITNDSYRREEHRNILLGGTQSDPEQWFESFKQIARIGLSQVPIFSRKNSLDLTYDDGKIYNELLIGIWRSSGIMRNYFASLIE
jgi:hypothetical protein